MYQICGCPFFSARVLNNIVADFIPGHTAMWYAVNAAKSDVEAYLNNVIKSGDVYEYSDWIG